MNAQKLKAAALPDLSQVGFDITQEIDASFGELLDHRPEPTLSPTDFVDCDLKIPPSRDKTRP